MENFVTRNKLFLKHLLQNMCGDQWLQSRRRAGDTLLQKVTGWSEAFLAISVMCLDFLGAFLGEW